MKRSAGHAVLMAKHPWLRKIYYGSIGGIMAIVGWGGAYECYIDYRDNHRATTGPLIILLLLLPFIVVGGEVYRYMDGAKKIKCIRCRNCGKEHPLKAIYKAGRCPECNSKKLVGVRHDGTAL
jgi:DNA-directed RNA polymerase subunit RPC12/RpoP